MANLLPIWRDFEVATKQDALPYAIYADDEMIFSGVANIAPNATESRIRINNICADYLTTRKPYIDESGLDRNIGCPTFSVKSGNTLLAEVRFSLDWSYDPAHDTHIAVAPIDRVIDPRQVITYSTYDEDEVSVEITFDNGEVLKQTIAIAGFASFSNDFSESFAMTALAVTAGTAIIKPSNYEGVLSVKVGNTTYKVQTTCKRYALYYLNAYGGWDSYVIGSTDTMTDAYSRSEFIRDNERVAYLNEVSRSWSLATGLMTDDEASRMHHLLGSNNVFLLDMESGEIHPVVITDTSCTHKTIKNSGRTFPTYTINVAEAKQRIRR